MSSCYRCGRTRSPDPLEALAWTCERERGVRAGGCVTSAPRTTCVTSRESCPPSTGEALSSVAAEPRELPASSSAMSVPRSQQAGAEHGAEQMQDLDRLGFTAGRVHCGAVGFGRGGARRAPPSGVAGWCARTAGPARAGVGWVPAGRGSTVVRRRSAPCSRSASTPRDHRVRGRHRPARLSGVGCGSAGRCSSSTTPGSTCCHGPPGRQRVVIMQLGYPGFAAGHECIRRRPYR